MLQARSVPLQTFRHRRHGTLVELYPVHHRHFKSSSPRIDCSPPSLRRCAACAAACLRLRCRPRCHRSDCCRRRHSCAPHARARPRAPVAPSPRAPTVASRAPMRTAARAACRRGGVAASPGARSSRALTRRSAPAWRRRPRHRPLDCRPPARRPRRRRQLALRPPPRRGWAWLRRLRCCWCQRQARSRPVEPNPSRSACHLVLRCPRRIAPPWRAAGRRRRIAARSAARPPEGQRPPSRPSPGLPRGWRPGE